MTYFAPFIPLVDCHPATGDFLSEALAGLSDNPKTLPCKYFYDKRGSELFDRICELPEYYPTRTEAGIFTDNIQQIAGSLGENAVVVEYGSGSSTKTRILLDHLEHPAAYIPIDISRQHLLDSAEALQQRYPDLSVLPVCADYTQDFPLPETIESSAKKVIFFPGSTIGNFHPDEAVCFLKNAASVAGEDSLLLIGVDLKKDLRTLTHAYNDSAGVTAAFNLNLLERLNNELGADFDLQRFHHKSVFNVKRGRIEMHLISDCDQTVHLGDRAFEFTEGETIHTENSYKYTLPQFEALAAEAGYSLQKVWTDPQKLFSVQLFEV